MIIENGSYGKRMAKICEVAGIETVSRQFILSALRVLLVHVIQANAEDRSSLNMKGNS